MTIIGRPNRWHCPKRRFFSLQRWSDGVVVYDETDGSLNALNPIAGEALGLLLAQSSMSPSELASALVQGNPTETDIAMVEDLLTHFESMDFIERKQA